MQIKKNSLLIEKVSGGYSCPHYIDPKMGEAVFTAYGLKAHDFEAVKLFTEVMENFGMALCEEFATAKIPVTRERIQEVVTKLKMV